MLLKNKVALITGAASGIGRATAELFAREGASVGVVDVNEQGGRETVRTIQEAAGEAVFFRGDVGSLGDVETTVQAAVDRYGRLDIVFSNAAAFAVGPATAISEEDWDRTLSVCLKATWMLARSAFPHMMAQGAGAMVITGSVHAQRGFADHTAYQAAKGGLLALTRALAADYAPEIRVNTVLPGAIDTGIGPFRSNDVGAKAELSCPLGRNGRPEEIAQAVLFLASDMSSYMTGSHVVVDGGLTSVILMEDAI